MGRTALRLVGLVWVVASLAATCARIPLWTEERRLWADAARQAPEKPRPSMNLAQQYAATGDTQGAEQLYRHALDLTATRTHDTEQRFAAGIARANLAILRCAQGDLEGAVAVLAPVLEETTAGRRSIPVTVAQWITFQRTTARCSPDFSF